MDQMQDFMFMLETHGKTMYVFLLECLFKKRSLTNFRFRTFIHFISGNNSYKIYDGKA